MEQQFVFEGMEGLEGMEGAAAGVAAIFLMFAAICIGVSLVIAAVICFIISGCFKRIPQQYREMEPGMVWLLLIPCFGLVWNFFVWLKLAKSYQAYFQAQGIADAGDYGYNLNLAYCIVTVCALVPKLNCLTFPASLVLLIICLVNACSIKNRIPESGTFVPGG